MHAKNTLNQQRGKASKTEEHRAIVSTEETIPKNSVQERP